MRRPRRRAILASILLLGLILTASASWLVRQGTRWTVPQAAGSGAGYALLATWDGAALPGGALERPIGIAVGPNGDVYVTDARLRVVHFSPSGEALGHWGRQGDGPGEFSNPVAVAVGRDGAVYVSDYEQDRVQIFSAAGEFLAAFGRPGSGPGEFNAPAGLAVDDAGRVYVADFYNHRVQVFRPDGSFDTTIGHRGRFGPGALHYPTGVAWTPRGELLVADAYNYRLQWFDRDGAPRRRIGYHVLWIWPRPVASAAGFFAPTDAVAGRDGVIHVADSGNRRIVMVSAKGEYLAEWRVPDADPSVFSPEHIAVSADGATVYATDLGRDRVLVLQAIRLATER